MGIEPTWERLHALTPDLKEGEEDKSKNGWKRVAKAQGDASRNFSQAANQSAQS